MSWGYHLIIDCKACEKNFNEPDIMKKFVSTLLEKIKMNAWGECQVEHFAEKPEIAGWTVIQPLTTSTLTMHFLDNSGDLYFDLFSCKKFDIQEVVDHLAEYFAPANIRPFYLERSA